MARHHCELQRPLDWSTVATALGYTPLPVENAIKPPRAAVGELSMAKLLRTAAWIVIGTITVVSLVSPSVRPGIALPHELEHLLIFGVVGLAFGLGYHLGHLYQMIGMVVFAGAIELAQYSVAGRHARMSDFIVDATSACIGVIVGWLAHKTISRRRKAKGRTALT